MLRDRVVLEAVTIPGTPKYETRARNSVPTETKKFMHQVGALEIPRGLPRLPACPGGGHIHDAREAATAVLPRRHALRSRVLHAHERSSQERCTRAAPASWKRAQFFYYVETPP